MSLPMIPLVAYAAWQTAHVIWENKSFDNLEKSRQGISSKVIGCASHLLAVGSCFKILNTYKPAIFFSPPFLKIGGLLALSYLFDQKIHALFSKVFAGSVPTYINPDQTFSWAPPKEREALQRAYLRQLMCNITLALLTKGGQKAAFATCAVLNGIAYLSSFRWQWLKVEREITTSNEKKIRLAVHFPYDKTSNQYRWGKNEQSHPFFRQFEGKCSDFVNAGWKTLPFPFSSSVCVDQKEKDSLAPVYPEVSIWDKVKKDWLSAFLS